MVLPAWKKMNTIDISSNSANEKNIVKIKSVYHSRSDKNKKTSLFYIATALHLIESP
jgi:hypothetical protein